MLVDVSGADSSCSLLQAQSPELSTILAVLERLLPLLKPLVWSTHLLHELVLVRGEHTLQHISRQMVSWTEFSGTSVDLHKSTNKGNLLSCTDR